MGEIGNGEMDKVFFVTVKETESLAPLSSLTTTVRMPSVLPFGTLKLITTLPLNWVNVFAVVATPPTVTVNLLLLPKPLPVRLIESPGAPSTGLMSNILAWVLTVAVTAG